ncbi:MAG: hypothetical protein N2450_01160 [bacterium]|nr:hypothetical protein [bacterium]
MSTGTMAQNYYYGDSFHYFRVDGLNGTTDTQRLILLNGVWQQIEPSEKTIRVPFCYDGTETIKLQRTFRLPDTLRADQFRLVCYGIGQAAIIRLNQEFLTIINGTNKLEIDIPKNQIYTDRENTIEIVLRPEVQNPLDFPLAASFYSPKRYSGIYRDIYLLALPEKRIEEFSINASWEDKVGKFLLKFLIRDTKVSTAITSQATTNDIRLHIQITSPKSETLFSTYIPVSFSNNSIQTGVLEQSIGNVQEWTPNQPHLYHLKLTLFNRDSVCHQTEAIFGFKKFQLLPNGISTSNELYQIRAANYVEEFPETGWAVTPYQIEKDLANAKLLGLNTLRIIGKPPHPYLYSLADKYGLWILIEPPIFLPPITVLKESGFRQHIITTIKDLLTDAEHHPCLLAVGTGFGIPIEDNENEVVELYRQFKMETHVPIYLSSPKLIENLPCDLYLLERLPHHTFQYHFHPPHTIPMVYSSIGMLVDPITLQGPSPEAEMKQTQLTIQFLQLPQIMKSSGFVLAALNDYQTMYPLLLRTPSPQPYLVTTGIWNFQRNPRPIFTPLRDFLTGINVRTVPIQSQKSEPPPHFLIGLLLILLIAAILFGRNKILRIHFYKTFMNTSRFWEEIREGRYFQYGESIAMLLLIAAVNSILAAAILHGLKFNPAFDLILTSLLQGNPIVKVYANRLIWNPILLILFLFVVLILISFVLSGFASLFSLFTKQRMSFQKAISYFSWSFVNHLFLLPIFIFLMNSITVKGISIGWVLLGLFMFCWSVYRLTTAIIIAYRNTAITAMVIFSLFNITVLTLLYYWIWIQKNIGIYWSSFRAAGW